MAFLCAVLVVCIHVYNPEDPPFWFVRWVAQGLAKIGVPFFFAVSGFFVVNHADRSGWYGQTLRKRVKTLAIPFFALNLFWFFANGALYWAGLRFSHSLVHPGLEITWRNFVRGMNPFSFVPLGLPALAVLWYVKVLMLLVVLSPLLAAILGRSRRGAGLSMGILFVLWTLQVLLSSLRPEWSVCLHRPGDFYHLFFFAAGIALRFWGPHDISSAASLVSGFLGLALLSVHVVGAEACPTPAALAEIFSWPLLLVGIWHWIPATPWPPWLIDNTFPLYVLHTMLRRVAIVVLKGCWLPAHPTSTPAALLWVAALVPASCALALLVKKHFPKIAAVFFGGR